MILFLNLSSGRKFRD